MTRRTLTQALHWSVFLLLLILLKGGATHPGFRWAFVMCGAAWIALVATGGILARPGPKLQGPLRQAFAPMHWGMVAILALSTVLNALALVGGAPQIWAWNSLLALLMAAIFHGIFHLWRHTSLNDGALRMIFPKAWHRFL